MPDAQVQQRNRWTYRREYVGGVRVEEPRVEAEPREGAESMGFAMARGAAEPGLWDKDSKLCWGCITVPGPSEELPEPPLLACLACISKQQVRAGAWLHGMMKPAWYY